MSELIPNMMQRTQRARCRQEGASAASSKAPTRRAMAEEADVTTPGCREALSRLSALTLNSADARSATPGISTPSAPVSKGEAASPAVCAICLSPVIALSESEFRTECCGNLFHKHCLARHKGYRSEASRSCPLCRSKAPTGLTPGRPKPVSQPTQPLFRTAAEERARRELGIPEDEPEEREQLAVLGYGPYAIARLAADPQYGPRAGMSDAARLLRAHDLDMLPAREDLPLAQSALLEEDEDEEDEESAGEEAEVVSREEEAEAPEPEEEAEASEEGALGEGEEEEAERNAVPVESP